MDQQLKIEEIKKIVIPPTPATLGLANVAPHFIDIQGHEPIRDAPRKYSQKMLKAAWDEVDRMLAEGIIEPSNGPWRSYPVLVPKTSDTFRFCIDYKRVHKKVQRSHSVFGARARTVSVSATPVWIDQRTGCVSMHHGRTHQIGVGTIRFCLLGRCHHRPANLRRTHKVVRGSSRSVEEGKSSDQSEEVRILLCKSKVSGLRSK